MLDCPYSEIIFSSFGQNVSPLNLCPLSPAMGCWKEPSSVLDGFGTLPCSVQARELLDFCGLSVEEGDLSDVNLGLSHCGTIPEDEEVLLVHSHTPHVPLWTSGFGSRLFIQIDLEIFYMFFCFI